MDTFGGNFVITHCNHPLFFVRVIVTHFDYILYYIVNFKSRININADGLNGFYFSLVISLRACFTEVTRFNITPYPGVWLFVVYRAVYLYARR
ncbi:MAG: hypothetical protein IKV21_00795, partial [Clostridia bacterium]|nr:hypothetical protein [Clostridia bacterium]